MQNVWLQIWLCWSLSTHPCCSLQSSSRAPAVVILSRSRCKCCIWSLASDADGGGVHVDVVVSADATRDCTSSSVFWNWRIFCNKDRKWFELVMDDLNRMENCLLTNKIIFHINSYRSIINRPKVNSQTFKLWPFINRGLSLTFIVLVCRQTNQFCISNESHPRFSHPHMLRQNHFQIHIYMELKFVCIHCIWFNSIYPF